MEAFRRFSNPLVLNLQKMELELTCPNCLKLFQKPMLLPCNHICCSDCVLALSKNGHDCSVCKEVFCDQDIRPSVYIETMVTIYRSMSSTINAFLKKGAQDGVVEKNAASVGSPYCDNRNSEEKLINSMVEHKPVYIKQNEMHMHTTEAEEHPKEKMPNSPESFSEPKISDYGSNDSGTEPRINASATLSTKRDLNLGCCQEVDDHGRELKKQKLNNSYAGFINTQSIYNCAFCHISKVTEVSGVMLHLLDGKEMVESEVSNPNTLHVHQKCIEWAPQAYFVDDKVMNLEAELVRSSKIKCTSCGLKGAALGCYVKSCRRSYHVPCAAEVSGCKWDTEKFLMLCPVHSSNKLPCDRSNVKRKKPSSDNPTSCDDSLINQVFPIKKLNLGLWTAPTSVTREWLLCGSGLSKREKDIMDRFASLSGIATTSNWDPNVTHVIAATDERGACARTLKLLMAILNGRWVVSIEWLKAIMEAGFAVQEEPYEITHDIHGSFDGPRTGRLRAMSKEPKMFAGSTFHFFGKFVPNYKAHLVNLILAAGGEVLEHCEISETTCVVYSCDLGGDEAEEIDELKRREEEAESFAARTCSRVVAHTWLLDSIAACSCSLSKDA